jgi:membrane-bound metal-dependent hydrolase YbcI (DUF457 family)
VFIGHFALAFAAKRAAPKASLGVLFAACQLPDLLWPVLVLGGVETVRIDPGNTAVTPLDFVAYPWSHSLLMDAVWAVLAAFAYVAVTRDRAGAPWVGGLVVSHWVLDWISHRADMPLWPGGPKVGLELWASLPATVLVEGGLYIAGIWLYATATRARDRTGGRALWVLVGFLAAVYAGNLAGPPPPSPSAVLWAVPGMWLLVAWAWWADRHRAQAAA